MGLLGKSQITHRNLLGTFLVLIPNVWNPACRDGHSVHSCGQTVTSMRNLNRVCGKLHKFLRIFQYYLNEELRSTANDIGLSARRRSRIDYQVAIALRKQIAGNSLTKFYGKCLMNFMLWTFFCAY